MSQPTNEQDDQHIRALIDAFGEASEAGDLATQLNLMTPDVALEPLSP
jgi:ketosteroid isomerase-like protein